MSPPLKKASDGQKALKELQYPVSATCMVLKLFFIFILSNSLNFFSHHYCGLYSRVTVWHGDTVLPLLLRSLVPNQAGGITCAEWTIWTFSENSNTWSTVEGTLEGVIRHSGQHTHSRTCLERPSHWLLKCGRPTQVVSGDRFSYILKIKSLVCVVGHVDPLFRHPVHQTDALCFWQSFFFFSIFFLVFFLPPPPH